MLSLKKCCQKIHQFFQHNYPYIWFASILTVVLVGFLHYELKKNNRDLIYWKNLFDLFYNELEPFALLLIMVIVLLKAVFVTMIYLMNSRSFHWVDELSQLEVKKRYMDFLFLRLIVDVDMIEAKYTLNNRTNELIALKSFIMAHDDMSKAIANFRKDARKLFTPNETEVLLPIEEVYSVRDDEEHVVRRSRFNKMDISANEELLKLLLNPE